MIINGLDIANSIKDNIEIKEGQLVKRLGVLYEGEEENQQSYIKRIKKDFESKNVIVDLWDIGGRTPMDKLVKIKAINELYDKILAVKPFSSQTQSDLDKLLLEYKDVDNVLNLKKGYSCTSEAVQEILKYVNISIQESNIVVLGSRGEGGDIIRILTNRFNNGTVTGIHSKTPQHLRDSLLSQAKVVVLATGEKDIYTMEDLETNTARELYVIDVGRGEITPEVVQYCKNNPNTHVTTSLHGVGVVTTACLLRRVLSN